MKRAVSMLVLLLAAAIVLELVVLNVLRLRMGGKKSAR